MAWCMGLGLGAVRHFEDLTSAHSTRWMHAVYKYTSNQGCTTRGHTGPLGLTIIALPVFLGQKCTRTASVA